MPPDNIPVVFNQLKAEFPPETEVAVQWFENNYLHGWIVAGTKEMVM